ncbi:MAG: sigma-70 family RNA polymerase sigma factor [Thermomicrobiales bacterium]
MGGNRPDARSDDETTLAILRDATLDPAAFAPLYRDYAPAIYRFCHRQLGDADLAADATSQTFVKVLGAVRTFQPHPDQPGKTFRAWLFRIAANVVIDLRRKERPTVPLDAGDDADETLAPSIPDPAPLPEELALVSDDVQAVREAVRALPERQRMILELRLAELSGAEIAEAMGIPISAVKSAQFRAFATLRRLLADHRAVPAAVIDSPSSPSSDRLPAAASTIATKGPLP